MKAIYYSNLVPLSLYREISEKTGVYSSQAIQKFHGLLCAGLEQVMELECVSSLPVAGRLGSDIVLEAYQTDKNYYTSAVKNTKLRQFFNFTNSFFHTLIKKKADVAFFDYLNFTVSLGGWLACKLKGIDTVLIVTDLPDMMVNTKTNFFIRLFNKFKYSWMTHFDKYILLTDAMNELVNPHHKAYMVMEGLVDGKYAQPNIENKKNIVLYAGGLYEKYGVKKLIDAFLSLDMDYELHLYGSGDMEDYIHQCANTNERLKFFGSVENGIVVEKLPTCTLLVNPRPSALELSKFSFPSKNLEYMVSGTPLLTAPLPGIPKEHYLYIYFFEDETEIGFRNKLKEILSKPKNELIEFGKEARNFVLNNKSNKKQAERILKFCER